MFIELQTMKSIDISEQASPQSGRPMRRLARLLWHALQQVAWGIDAGSRVRHGIEVPPEHGARNRVR